MKRVCEPTAFPPSEEIINKCHQGLKWNPVWNATEKFSLLTSMFEGYTREYLQQELSERGTSDARPKRFVISTPILVGTAIGAASLATVGVTAAVVANAEVQVVVEAEKLH